MDGRGCEDYRCVEVETDVVSNTSGSARVKLVSAMATVRARWRNGYALGNLLQPFGAQIVLGWGGIPDPSQTLGEGLCRSKDPSSSPGATSQVPALLSREALGVCVERREVVGAWQPALS